MDRTAMNTKKGTTDQMLVLILVVVMALVLLIIFFVVLQPDSPFSRMYMAASKSACGTLTHFGIGKAICNW